MPHPKLSALLPELAEELRAGLDDHPALAAQIGELEIFGRCECGDSFCSTLYTAPQPNGPYGPGLKNVVVDMKGMVILDVVDGEIRCVEVLFRGDVRAALEERLKNRA